MWEIFFDAEQEKWLVSEFWRSTPETNYAYFFRSEAELSCARRNGFLWTLNNAPFWTEGEADAFE